MTAITDFDPDAFLVVPARTFEDLRIGEVFRAPSRTLTDAHAAAFQTVSMDNHPVHYDAEWARTHGHVAPVVHGLKCWLSPHREPPCSRTSSARCSSRQPLASGRDRPQHESPCGRTTHRSGARRVRGRLREGPRHAGLRGDRALSARSDRRQLVCDPG